MPIACLLGHHAIAQAGVRNGTFEFARCDRCRCDLMRAESRQNRSAGAWRRVPKGFKVVWRPRGPGGTAGEIAVPGSAAFAREVDLRGVTVVGERTLGAQRFALVILNARDERDYGAMIDPLGMDGPISARAARLGPSRPRRQEETHPETVYDLLGKDAANDAGKRRGPDPSTNSPRSGVADGRCRQSVAAPTPAPTAARLLRADNE